MTETMRAAVLHDKRDLRIEEVPIPVAGPGEVLLRVRAVGVCGTDAGEYSHGPTMMPVLTPHPVTGHHGPMIIGHEFAGEVVAVGGGVDPSLVGRLVASCGAISCGTCWQCQRGRTNLCVSYAAVGLHRHGAAAEFVAAPLASCEPVDQLGIPPDAAALGQPMSIAVHAARRGRATRGERAVLIGAGGIGTFLGYVLGQLGVGVLVVEPDPARRVLAAQLGAAAAVEPAPELDPGDILGGPPHLVFEASGSAAGLKQALSMLPPGGRLVTVGLQTQPATLDLRHSTLVEHEIIGTNAMVRTPDLLDALRLVAARQGGWADIAPTAMPLDDLVTGALEPLAAGAATAVKLLIDPQAASARPADTVPRRDAATTAPERI